jgi:hypothetical protein
MGECTLAHSVGGRDTGNRLVLSREASGNASNRSFLQTLPPEAGAASPTFARKDNNLPLGRDDCVNVRHR